MALPPPPPGFVPEGSRTNGMFGAKARGMSAPPPPPGFSVDPLETVRSLGVNISSGYRSPARNRRVGGVPNSEHLSADALDLTPPQGMDWGDLKRQADGIAASWGRGARVVDESRTGKPHIHLQLPGWGGAPGIPAPPAGFQPIKAAPASAPSIFGAQPAGTAHDGDTFKLSNGLNARLSGVDAFELRQQGRSPTGQVIPLGQDARNALLPFAVPGSTVTGTGGATYGRPVVTLNNGRDAGASLLRQGFGIAAPQYLKGDPRFAPYMEAERQARLNRLGAHGNTYQTPDSFRAGNPDPWEKPDAGTYGEGQAVFWDEPTPFMGLRPEIEKAYVALWQSPDATPEAVIQFAKDNGFNVNPEEVRKGLAEIKSGRSKPGSEVVYSQPAKPITDPGDGKLGTTLRGLGDPINMIDELGGVADSLGFGMAPDGPRESIWNSDRRFGDILWNNIDQNRSILGHDDATHPYYRLGGQLASGIVLPAATVEGVAAQAFRKAMAEGASSFAAREIASKAVMQRLALAGSIEGGLAGGGSGEGGLLDRAPNAALGTLAGATGGVALGGAVNAAPGLWRAGKRLLGRDAGDAGTLGPDAMRAAREAAPVAEDGLQSAGPTPAARNQPAGGVVANGDGQRFTGLMADEVERVYPAAVVRAADGSKAIDYAKLPPEIAASVRAMADETGAEPFGRSAAMAADSGAELVGIPRQRDYIDLGGIPPPPPGYVRESFTGGARRMDARASAAQMAQAAGRFGPDDIIPLPQNRVETLEESLRANPGRFEDLQAPNPLDELGVRRIASGRDLFKGTRIRGPFDVTKQVRRWGGVKDQGGELSHLGISNSARRGLPFGGNEQFLGRLIDNEKGLSLDELGERLFDEGWVNERPTVSEVVDILHREHLGESLYHPETLEEVGRFTAAQAEANRINKARDEGSPLAAERGVPATQDDLAANETPAIAYEDLPRYAAGAGNINTGALDSKEDIARALINTERMFGGFDAARRGKISHAETEALAAELGMRSDDLLRRRHGQAFNAEEALAARAILSKSADELVALARKAKGGSDEDLTAFRAAMLRHGAIQEQVSGMTAEAGRTLSQFRAVAKSSKHRERVLKDLIQNHGGRDGLEAAADAIIDLQRVPGALNKFARDSVKPTWKDKAVELWYNSLLSGPQTHAVNIVSNAITALGQIPEHATAALIGQLRRGSTDRVLLSELGPRVVGLTQGAMEGLRAFRYTFKTGKVPDLVSKVETAQDEAIAGLKGKIIRTPTRLLSAEDEFFKAVARRSEIASLAVRKARGEGLRGDALSKRIDDLTANPTDEMWNQALDFARYSTFQRPVGKVAGAVLQATTDQPWLKLFLPFVRTPTNILKYAVERSPAAPLLKEVRADFAAGGARRDLAIAKATLGTGLGLLVTQLAASGSITGGGPADENAKRLLMADGWQPYSVKIGDKYYSYQRLDPLATTLGVAADTVELQSKMTDRQADEVAETVVASIIGNLSDKTWLSGASDLVSAINDPQRYGSQFVNRLAGSVAVPAGVAQLARTIDPTPRETKNPLEAAQARIPGLSDNLRPRLDAWGRPMPKEGGVGPDIISPFYQSTRRDEPINREALAIGAKLSDPSRTVGGRRLDDGEFHQYRTLSGQILQNDFSAVIASPEWRGLAPAERKKAFDNLKRDARRTAREMLGLATGDDGEEQLIPPPPAGFTPDQTEAPARPSKPRPGMFGGNSRGRK